MQQPLCRGLSIAKSGREYSSRPENVWNPRGWDGIRGASAPLVLLAVLVQRVLMEETVAA